MKQATLNTAESTRIHPTGLRRKLWGALLMFCASFAIGCIPPRLPKQSAECERLMKHANQILLELSKRDNAEIDLLEAGEYSKAELQAIIELMELRASIAAVLLQQELEAAGCDCQPVYFPPTPAATPAKTPTPAGTPKISV